MGWVSGRLNTCPLKVTAITNHARYIPGLRYLPCPPGWCLFPGFPRGNCCCQRSRSFNIHSGQKTVVSLALGRPAPRTMSSFSSGPHPPRPLGTLHPNVLRLPCFRCQVHLPELGPRATEGVGTLAARWLASLMAQLACLPLSLAHEDVDLRLDSGSVSRGLFPSPF